MSEKIIFRDDFEKSKKNVNNLIKARNRAAAEIKDAMTRYVKSKTRARSKKAALEKDAVINSKRFAALKDYDRREDIVEMYGWGSITEKQKDKLEALWDEREELKKNAKNGVYSDKVTEILQLAENYVLGMYENEIADFDEMERTYRKQMDEVDQELRKRDEEYKAWKNGWNKKLDKEGKTSEQRNTVSRQNKKRKLV